MATLKPLNSHCIFWIFQIQPLQYLFLYEQNIQLSLRLYCSVCATGWGCLLNSSCHITLPQHCSACPSPTTDRKKGGRLRGSLFYPCLSRFPFWRNESNRELAVQRKWGFLSGEVLAFPCVRTPHPRTLAYSTTQPPAYS